MTLPAFEFVEPRSLRHACRLLEEQQGRAALIAGGTDLLQSLRYRLKTPATLIALSGIPRLDAIRYDRSKGLRIGALVSLRQLARDQTIKSKYPVLAKAAQEVGTVQLQAMGTVGGNLCQDNLCLYYNRPPMSRLGLEPCLKLGGAVCHAVSGSNTCWAVYSGDLAPVLMALQASVTIANGQWKRTVSLSELYSGDGAKSLLLSPGEIVTEIRVPPPAPRSGSAYFKLRLRQVIDYPLLGVAAHLNLRNGACENVRVALTGVDKAPLLIPEARELEGKKIGEEEIAMVGQAAHRRAHPLSNVSEVTPKYRREMIDVYVRFALLKARENATWEV